MKKILFGFSVLALGMTAYGQENHLYLKAGGNVVSLYSKYKYQGVKATKGETKGIGYELTIEGTRDINNNFEVGLGIAYQNHNKLRNYSFVSDGDNNTIAFGKYDSVPLYLTGKYNFEPINGWKPYVKANLGYSFNINEKNTKLTIKEPGLSPESHSYKTKVKNGIYAGIAAGAEYNNFLIDLTYSANYSKATVSVPNEKTKSRRFDFGRIVLSAGYKFDF